MKKNKFKLGISLFLVFLKIGTFTFGGGYAMIPIIQAEIAKKRKWIEENDILDIIAIAESTPGPIAINSATFVGYQIAGIFGSVCATVGVIIPSLVIIYVVSYFFDRFMDFKVIRYAFFGIRAGVLALIVKAVVNMYKACPKTWLSYVIAASAFVATTVFDVNVFIVIISSAVIGLVVSLILDKKKEGVK